MKYKNLYKRHRYGEPEDPAAGRCLFAKCLLKRQVHTCKKDAEFVMGCVL